MRQIHPYPSIVTAFGFLVLRILVLVNAAFGQTSKSTHVLGPGDQISVRALDLEEFGNAPYRIDNNGVVTFPLIGRVQVSGLSLDELERSLREKLKHYVLEPQILISIAETRSQPVSVVGAVRNPGVQQVQGSKSLYEVISLVGGLASDAGHTVKVTRQIEWGQLPLANAKLDQSGKFSVGEVSIKSILNAEKPEDNIQVMPHDIISVPKGDIVYVIGSVKRAGGFVLGERERVTALQALSMAEGFEQFAAPAKAKIIRTAKQGQKQEIALDLRKILQGKAPDVPMEAEDILFVPNSSGKRAASRAIDAAVGVGSGIAIWRAGAPR